MSAALLLVCSSPWLVAIRRTTAAAPKGIQSFFEPIIIFIRDEVAKKAIGPKYERYMPYLLTVFFFHLVQ